MTDDHIPPKNLFRKPYPNNLITVPSCKPCNGGSSMDDEYFRLWATVREDVKGNRDREGVLPSVLRGLEKPEALRFANSFLDGIIPVRRVTPAGLDLGVGRLLTGSGARLDSVAKRIIKGLFFYKKGRRLPDDHCVQTVHVSRWGLLPGETRDAADEFVAALLNEKPERIGDAFGFWHLWSPNGWARSLWLLEFYGRIEFFCTTCPVNLPEGREPDPPLL